MGACAACMTCLYITGSQYFRKRTPKTKGANSRSFGITEPGPLNRNPRIPLLGLITDLATDMLTFAITIGPDEQNAGPGRLLLDILGDGLLVPVDGDVGDGVEELAGRARPPAAVLRVKVQAR